MSLSLSPQTPQPPSSHGERGRESPPEDAWDPHPAALRLPGPQTRGTREDQTSRGPLEDQDQDRAWVKMGRAVGAGLSAQDPAAWGAERPGAGRSPLTRPLRFSVNLKLWRNTKFRHGGDQECPLRVPVLEAPRRALRAGLGRRRRWRSLGRWGLVAGSRSLGVRP